MTIDEAIKKAEELAELNEVQAQIYREQDDIIGAWSYEECANEHRQLAEWLRELKELRREHTCEECRYSSYGFSDHPCSVCRRGYYPRHSMTDYYEMGVNADDE